MDAVKYFQERARLSKDCNLGCKECRLSSYNNGTEMSCDGIERKFPELAVEIIEKWSAEHPIKTRQSEFLKLFPYANTDPEGVLGIDPCSIDKKIAEEEEACDKFSGCLECKKNYWLAEVK